MALEGDYQVSGEYPPEVLENSAGDYATDPNADALQE